MTLSLAGLPAGARDARVTHYRIDESHSNAYGEWKRMGSPLAPNETQYRRLLDASKLATIDQPNPVRESSGTMDVRFTLPRQGVSLLVLDWNGTR